MPKRNFPIAVMFFSLALALALSSCGALDESEAAKEAAAAQKAGVSETKFVYRPGDNQADLLTRYENALDKWNSGGKVGEAPRFYGVLSFSPRSDSPGEQAGTPMSAYPEEARTVRFWGPTFQAGGLQFLSCAEYAQSQCTTPSWSCNGPNGSPGQCCFGTFEGKCFVWWDGSWCCI